VILSDRFNPRSANGSGISHTIAPDSASNQSELVFELFEILCTRLRCGLDQQSRGDFGVLKRIMMRKDNRSIFGHGGQRVGSQCRPTPFGDKPSALKIQRGNRQIVRYAGRHQHIGIKTSIVRNQNGTIDPLTYL
jgi:hypothetical protein